MKSLLLLAVLLCAVTPGSSLSSVSKASNVRPKHIAVMRFDQPVRLQGVMLKGEYLFVHDDAAMMRGETCTRVYQGSAELPANLVVSFHCSPVARKVAARFTVRIELFSGIDEVREFQFAGEAEGHLVPPGQVQAKQGDGRQQSGL